MNSTKLKLLIQNLLTAVAAKQSGDFADVNLMEVWIEPAGIFEAMDGKNFIGTFFQYQLYIKTVVGKQNRFSAFNGIG